MIINNMKYLLGIIITLMLFTSCRPIDEGDTKLERICVKLNTSKSIKLYRHRNFLELTGVFCDFFENDKKNKESYSLLMKKLDRKNWDFEFISLEYESSCFNDSLFVQFKKLNHEVFKSKLKSITFEDEIIVIKLR
jgi:hypothetical protein